MTAPPEHKPRIALTPDQERRLLSRNAMPSSVTLNGNAYTLEQPAGSGFKGVVWRIKDRFARDRALKLTLEDDYEDRSYLQELQLAARLEGSSYFAQFIDAGLIEIRLEDGSVTRMVAFIEEWVPGITLAKFLASRPDEVTPVFLLGYVRGLCNALGVLRACDLRHDDLHTRNVMLADPKVGEIDRSLRVRVIDTGSLKLRSTGTLKTKDDHRNFVDHLVLLYNRTLVTRPLAIADRRFLSETVHLLEKMLDDDPSTRLDDPKVIAEQFDLAFARSRAPRSGAQRPLGNPFEFISAEHIADDRLLVDIFATSCPWLDKVAGPDPCLVTGPRGCGKSMMFRWLSLKAHLHKSLDSIDSLPLAGFYLSCSTDLQNRLSWIRTEALATRFEKELTHYFNLLLLREITLTLGQIALRADREEYWGFSESAEQRLCDFLLDRLGLSGPLRLQGSPRLYHLSETIEASLFSTHDKILRGLNVGGATPASFLGDVTSYLTRHVDYFERKPIAFLLDDFSLHRLPLPVQVILNRVIWERRSSHVFKLSSEKHGATFHDNFAATADIAREFVEIDCGREYLALDDVDQVGRAVRFAEELLDNRLEAAQYAGRSATLVGHSQWAEGSLARALAEKPPGRSTDQYHGIECIANVCSGDVSTLLLVYRRLFEIGNVGARSEGLVAPRQQHDAIVSVSRELFEAIKHQFPSGPEMYAVVNEFGRLARRILEDGKWQRKGSSQVPSQCPRIEIDQAPQRLAEQFTSAQRELAKELIRRAIFIEMEPGLSRHGNTTSLRWQLRRVYLPAFGAALAKNNAVKRDIDWFKHLLTDPKAACELVWAAWPKRDDSPELPLRRQRGLFPSKGESNEPT